MAYKYIILDNEITYFRIYDDGKIMSEKTGKYYKGTIRNGYCWYDLRYKNKKYSRSQHRLLAEAFIDNPNHLSYIHHIDGNRLNNSLENLQWVSASENNLKNNRHLNNSIDHNDYNVYEGVEEWKTYKNTRYMVSNWGRVKNADTDKLLKVKLLLVVIVNIV